MSKNLIMTSSISRLTRTFSAAALALAAGCTPAHEHPGSDGPGETPDLQSGPVPVVISWKAVVGSKPFACGQSYSGIGGETVKPADFRLYVQDLALLTTAGTAVPVSLTPDGKWQTTDVALLDFEDRTGDCTGTAETNTELRGTVPMPLTNVSGLRFTVGVPFSQNHQDRAVAPPPLNLSAMFWSWQSGYRFVRVEGKTNAGTYVLHLGSTGCQKDAGGQVTGCTSPNRDTVTLSGFELGTRRVVIDLAALLAGSNLASAAECHSQSDAAECAPYFKALGIPFMGQTATQSVFRIE